MDMGGGDNDDTNNSLKTVENMDHVNEMLPPDMGIPIKDGKSGWNNDSEQKKGSDNNEYCRGFPESRKQGPTDKTPNEDMSSTLKFRNNGNFLFLSFLFVQSILGNFLIRKQ